MGTTNGYSSVEPEEEQQQPSSPTEIECRFCLVRFTVVILVVSILGGAWMFYVNQTSDQVPHYSLSIDSVSGLDPATDLGQKPTLHPEFNLTLRVASHGLWVSECADPSIYVEVSYRGYKLAASATLIHQICAGPRGEVEHPIIARGSGVVMPGPELDSLTMDMRSGVPEFNVKLCDPKAVWWSGTCGPRTVGDAGALGRECDRFSFE